MKRIINFQISTGGLPSIVERVEYESRYSSVEDIRKTPYPEVFDVMTEAEDALRKKIGHSDYSIIYWDWVN